MGQFENLLNSILNYDVVWGNSKTCSARYLITVSWEKRQEERHYGGKLKNLLHSIFDHGMGGKQHHRDKLKNSLYLILDRKNVKNGVVEKNSKTHSTWYSITASGEKHREESIKENGITVRNSKTHSAWYSITATWGTALWDKTQRLALLSTQYSITTYNLMCFFPHYVEHIAGYSVALLRIMWYVFLLIVYHRT